MGKYDDIINLDRPRSKREKMPVAERAKIFMPFSALTGYGDVIAEKQKITTERAVLSEERKAELDYKIQMLRENSHIHNKKVKVCHFVRDEKVSQEEGKELGKYKELEGTLEKLDCISRQVTIDETVISLADIVDICIENRPMDF